MEKQNTLYLHLSQSTQREQRKGLVAEFWSLEPRLKSPVWLWEVGDTGCNDKIKQRQNKLQQVRFVSWPDLWNMRYRKYLVGGATAEICPDLWGLRTQGLESLLCPANWDSWSLTTVLVRPSIFFLSLRWR